MDKTKIRKWAQSDGEPSAPERKAEVDDAGPVDDEIQAAIDGAFDEEPPGRERARQSEKKREWAKSE